MEVSDNVAVNVALLALALAVCFFGYKLVKVWITVLGGLVGLVALGFVFQWKTTGEDPEQGN